MINLKYIETEQAGNIEQVIKACLDAYPEGFFKVYDTEEFICKSRNAERILKEIDGGDEEINLNFYNDFVCIGWFGVLPYEEADGVIYDHSDNDFCNSVFKKIFNN